MDRIFDFKIGDKSAKGMSGEKVKPENIPPTFDFQFQYTLSMTTEDGTMDMNYFLMPGANYIGTSFSQSGATMFMIIDGEKSIFYNFIDAEGQKIVSAFKLDVNPFDENEKDYPVEDDLGNLDDLTMTDLPPKTFLGYECEGRLIENEEYSMTMYFTTEAPVSFEQVFKGDDKRFPDSITKRLQQYEGALMMYLEYNLKNPPKKAKKKDKSMQNAKMECTLLEAKNFSFDTTEYQSF
jgi:hypothetical protein